MVIEEEIFRYEFYIPRNKLKSPAQLGTIKKEMYKKNPSCNLCNKPIPLTFLDLDHKIPVMLAGHLFKKDNLQLLCKRCHTKKTQRDIKIISIIKKLGILKGHYSMDSFIFPSKLEELYLYFYDFLKKYDFSENIWSEEYAKIKKIEYSNNQTP